MHTEAHPFAGKTVKIVLKSKHPQLEGLEHEYTVEDWWDKLTGGSWMDANGNFAAMFYGIRMGLSSGERVPLDDEVVYGKINNLGHLIHVSELTEEVVGA